MTILRDPVWQFVGAVLAILVPLVSWWFVTQKKEKALTYDNLISLPLLTIGDEVKDKIKVLYDGREIGNLYVIIVSLKNEGRKPILPEDFDEPIRFNFSKGSVLLTVEVLETVPQNLLPKIKIGTNDDSFTIAPTLLNSDDAITFKVLIENNERRPFCFPEARIVDIHKIELKPAFSPPFIIAGILSFLLIFVWIFWLGTGGSRTSPPRPEISPLLGLLIILGPMLVFGAIGGFLLDKGIGKSPVKDEKYLKAYLGEETVKRLRRLFGD